MLILSFCYYISVIIREYLNLVQSIKPEFEFDMLQFYWSKNATKKQPNVEKNKHLSAKTILI